MTIKHISGLVVRSTPLKDSDRLLYVLTKEEGIIRLYAKYAGKPGRNMLVSTEVISFTDFEISGDESKGFFVKSAQMIEGFKAIKMDVIRLTYCSHLIEIVLDSLVDVSISADVFMLFIHTLQHMTKPECDLSLTVHVFEMKMMNILGLMPLLDICASCKKPVHTNGNGKERMYFSYAHCGICCADPSCRLSADQSTLISGATLACMKYIAQSPVTRVFSFSLKKEYLCELSEISTRFLCERMEKSYTKLTLLEDFSC